MAKEWGLIGQMSHRIQNGCLRMLGVINATKFYMKKVDGTISPRALQVFWPYVKVALRK
jgi:hypothetical protein